MFSHEDKSIFQPMIKILVFIEITIIEFYKYIIKYWQKNQWDENWSQLFRHVRKNF